MARFLPLVPRPLETSQKIPTTKKNRSSAESSWNLAIVPIKRSANLLMVLMNSRKTTQQIQSTRRRNVGLTSMKEIVVLGKGAIFCMRKKFKGKKTRYKWKWLPTTVKLFTSEEIFLECILRKENDIKFILIIIDKIYSTLFFLLETPS